MELWQQCVRWLRSSGLLEECFCFKSLEEFALFLSDGVFLCRLAHELDPAAVDESHIHQACTSAGASQFISSTNISRFLKACKDSLGLADADLFEEADLYELSNFKRVLHALSLLSWSEKSRALGLVPFPQTEPPNRAALAIPHEEEDLYTELRYRADHLNDEALAIRQNYTALHGLKQKRDEQLYSSFVEKKRAFSTFKPSNRREFHLKELLDTENNFCDTLAMIIHDYYEPMSRFVSDDDMTKIFINIKDIFTLHQDFLRYLRKAVMASLGLEQQPNHAVGVGDEMNVSVGDVFMAFKARFIIYGQYCAYLENGRDHVMKLIKDNPDLGKRLMECSQNSEQPQFKLWDLLTVPMQRILKYHLMLKQIFDNTDIASPEHKVYEDAYEGMNDVNQYINEAKRDFETTFFFQELMQKVQNECNYLAFGRPIQDGQVKVYDSKTSDSSKQRHVFLFERMIMFCKAGKGDKYEFRNCYALSDLQMADEDEQNNRNSTLGRKLTQTLFDHSNSFMLVFRRSIPTSTVPATEPPGCIQFVFKNEAQRDLWKKNVERALEISEPTKANGHKVYYKTFKEATNCDACKKLLWGLFLQGYNCKVCNKNLHFDCLGLQQCPGLKPAAKPRMSHHSFSAGQINRISPRYMPGEHVQACQSIASPDSAVLNFQKDDVIEIVQENADGTLTGRLLRSPTKIGVIRRDSVRRMLSSPSFGPGLNNNNNNNTLPNGVTHIGVVENGANPHLPPNKVQRRSSFTHLQQVDNQPAGRIQPRRSTHERISTSSICDIPGCSTTLVSKAILESHCPAEDDHPIKDYPWYFSDLSRVQAQKVLEKLADGTFLVRWSPNNQQYALSVAYMGRARHIKIEFDTIKQMYYLHDSLFFHNIPSLIKCYQATDLHEGFSDIYCTLQAIPLRTTTYQAFYSYKHPSDQLKYLVMEEGDVINVLETSVEGNGWWKGELERSGKIGYFPLAYVREVPPYTDECLMT